MDWQVIGLAFASIAPLPGWLLEWCGLRRGLWVVASLCSLQ